MKRRYVTPNIKDITLGTGEKVLDVVFGSGTNNPPTRGDAKGTSFDDSENEEFSSEGKD